jgi:hypothetical protein
MPWSAAQRPAQQVELNPGCVEILEGVSSSRATTIPEGFRRTAAFAVFQGLIDVLIDASCLM